MTTGAVLERLERSGLIRLVRSEPDVEYAFSHALIQEAAYGSLARADRRALHRAAGEILEALTADQADETASTLAYHFARADLPDRAFDYQLRAADRAARSFANREAIDLYRAALEGTGAETAEPEQVAQAYERFGGVLELVGRIDDAIAAFDRALAGTAADDAIRQARMHRHLGTAHRLARRIAEARGSFGTATAILDGVLAAERDEAWWAERLDLLLDRAWLHYFWGTLSELAAVLEECAPEIERYGNPAQRTRYYARLALLKARTNHMIVTDEALRLQRVAYHAWEATGDPTDAELARFQLGFFHLWRGEDEAAVHYLNESLRAAELAGDVVLQSRCLTFLALAARFSGDVDGMEQIHTRAIPVLAAGDMTEYQAVVAGNRAWAAWRRGDTSAVQSHAAETLRLSALLPGKYGLEWTIRLPLMAMAVERGDLADAMGHAAELDEAVWVDEEYGNQLQAAIRAHAAGRADEAREYLQAALERAVSRGWV